MEFTEISAKDFRAFAAKSPYQSFMQTPELAGMRAKSGWTPYYLAAKDGKKLLAAALVMLKPSFLGKSVCFVPGGPLLDLENRELADFFFTHLAEFAKTHGAYVLRLDPYYELIQRDVDGQLVAGGFDHRVAVHTLERHGFHRTTATTQPRFLFALDIAGRTPDQLLASFKQRTRRYIRHAERQGVTVRELTRAELPLMKQITAATADRRHFTDQPLSYYEAMYDQFAPRGEVKFMLAEAPVDGHLTPMSAAMFMLYGPEVTYLFSGSAQQFMKSHSAQYLIQWHMLQYAAEHGFARYNFYGIEDPTDPRNADDGVYLFKKGFGGHVVELIGTYELPLSQPTYHLHEFLSKLKRH